MIHRKTVFVLGAGASMPYGLPSGAQLRQDIVRAARNPDNHRAGMNLLRQGGVERERLAVFGDAFAHSSIASIDTFLAKRREPEFHKIGKLAIAAVICAYEVAEKVFADVDDHWLRLLWNVLLRDADDPDAVARNTIRFITFNYDRSLEFFFFHAVKNSWGLQDDQAAAIMAKIPILHVYGMLGPFAHARADGKRMYEEPLSGTSIELAADSIHVIPEARADTVFTQARTWFAWAEQIAFLGFGFDALNVQRLDLRAVIENARAHAPTKVPSIFATVVGRTTQEELADRAALLGTGPAWGISRVDCTTLLRETPLLDL